MKQRLGFVLAMALVGGMVVAGGCAQKAASSSEAIQHAKTLKTPEEQANYLVSQAKAFVNSKEFAEATKIAQYVLSNVDSNSQAARQVLEDAKAHLAQAAQGAASEAKKALGSFGSK